MCYIELHACSAFSFLRGGSFPEQLAEVAAELEMAAMALLDRNGIYGAQRFSVAALENNVRPIIGCELSMEDDSILPVLVEIQRHFIRGEDRINRELVDLARTNRLSILATNGVQYAKPYGREVLDVFTCIREHTHLDTAGKLLAQNAERYLKSDREMRELFRDLPEAIENTSRLAERLTFSLENLGYEFPEYPVPASHTMDSFLRTIVWFGAQQRYAAISFKVKHQLEEELALITKLGFAGYFLIVWDIVNFCREHNIMVQGRGSAANSAVCYCLGITPVDPVSNHLIFERFLNESRKGWPDIDLDLPSGDRREAVIQEIYRRYGKHGAAMTANVITYRGRSAAREIGKALNFSP